MDLDKLAKPFLKSLKPYRPGKPIEQLQRERGIPGPIAKLASNENPYPPHEAIRRAVTQAMDSANRYPESGAPDLVKRLAAEHGVETSEVCVANGTNETLDLLIRAYVGPEENCVFSELSFLIYKLVCLQNGVGFSEVPCKDYTHDLERMADAIDDKTKLVFVCNPNNPTGTYNTRAEIDVFLRRVPDHTLIVMDEAYFEFVTAADYPMSLEMRKEKENLVILRTFSKYYSLAGMRVGYAVADPRVVDILNKMRQPFNVNRLAQCAAEAALGCKDALKPFIDETVREREAMRDALLGMGCECPPSQTNFLFVIPGESTADGGDLCERLERKGVIVRPMAPFGAPPNTFRVNTGTPEENKRFIDAFRAIVTGRA